MKQESISIENSRSDFSGDKRQGNIRIKQVITDGEVCFEVWTDPGTGLITIHQETVDRIYSADFKRIGDKLVVCSARTTISEEGDKKEKPKFKCVDNISFYHIEKDCFGIRNNLAFGQDTIVNDTSHTTTEADLRLTYGRQFKIVEFAEVPAMEFLRKEVDVIRRYLAFARASDISI